MYKCKVKIPFRTKFQNRDQFLFELNEECYFTFDDWYFVRKQTQLNLPDWFQGVPFTQEEFKKYFITDRQEKLKNILNEN